MRSIETQDNSTNKTERIREEDKKKKRIINQVSPPFQDAESNLSVQMIR
jgi:hypothetical protein